MQRKIIQVEERPPLAQGIPLSFQHLFAMFGASILVPLLFGIQPGIVLLMNGIGTLIYILITKGKAPAYLGSSFALISPVLLVMGGSQNAATKFPLALGGFVVVGAIITIVALIIWAFGTKWIDIILPPAAMGPIVALIGLTLAGTAASESKIPIMDTFAGNKVIYGGDWKNVTVFLITLLVAVFGSIMFRKFFAVIPILIAIVVGYISACCFGLVDLSKIMSNGVFIAPNFQLPRFDLGAIAIIAPAALVIVTEHIGHQVVTSKIVGRDLIKDPGLHRTMISDGISTMLSGFVGSVPTTTYGENIGVMAITKVYSVWVIGGAAVISIIIAFFGPVSNIISSIPGPVIGGVCFMLYGMIAASGLRLLVEAKVDYSRSRNLALTSVVFVTGLSGAFIPLSKNFLLSGLTLATVVGMLLGLAFYAADKLKLTNDRDEPEEIK